MIEANETFEGTWPFAPHFHDGNGFRQHYIDEPGIETGDPADENTIICIHGEPTWGYLYRKFIPRLARHGRVIVPDHMGFGKSETPQDRDYSIREHSDNLENLLMSLDVKNVTLVLQDWGGPIGSSFAIRHPELIRCLCICNTGVPWARAPAGTYGVTDHDWFKWAQTDAFEPTILNLGATALSVMKRIGFERTGHVDETWIRAYASPFETPAECRGALQFPRNIANPETFEFFLELAEQHGLEQLQSIPAMCVHGEADRAIPVESAIAGFKSFWPDGPVVTLPGVGHFLQEDAPEAVSALIEQFMQLASRLRAAE